VHRTTREVRGRQGKLTAGRKSFIRPARWDILSPRTRRPVMRAWLPLLCCPLLSGCFGFAYPSVSETPAVAVIEPDVRAFRVVSECTVSGPCITGPIQFSRQVEEVPGAWPVVQSQQDAYLAYHYLLFPVLNGSRSRSLQVLLYRPGYETIEIPARS